jgi:hypothetical protein
MSERELVKEHFQALVRAGDGVGIPHDVLGRLLLSEITALWLETRSCEDVASELQFSADSLDPERDFEFMRP